MLAWVRSVGQQNGFVVVISNSAKLRGRKMPRCILGCERGGSYRSGGILSKILRRNTGTQKCECPFQLQGIPIGPDGVRWGVMVICGVHNHEPAENFEGHEYPSRLKPAERGLVNELANSTAPREILSILKKKYTSNTTGIKSVYNAINSNKEAKRGGLNITQYVLDQLIKNGYFHDLMTDEYTNEITDIVWAHPTSLELSVNFSSVLVMDATYKTNEYRKPLLEVVGMTSTNLTFSIMFAYLNNERQDRVTWALDTLKKWMVGKGASLPLVCVTDRDLALMNAVEACFPMARHILCIWHINQAVMKNCGAALGPRFQDFYHSWHSLINSSSSLTFQHKWGAMCEEYGQYPRVINYLADTWLRPYKERFITAWTDAYMHLGSNSSQRYVSFTALLYCIHSIVRHYLIFAIYTTVHYSITGLSLHIQG